MSEGRAPASTAPRASLSRFVVHTLPVWCAFFSLVFGGNGVVEGEDGSAKFEKLDLPPREQLNKLEYTMNILKVGLWGEGAGASAGRREGILFPVASNHDSASRVSFSLARKHCAPTRLCLS